MGEERFFSGNMRANNLINTVELNIEYIQKLDPDELIREYEAG